MDSRIVKNTELHEDPYRLGYEGAQEGGLLLRTLQKHRPDGNHEKRLREIEEKIIALGLQALESRAADVIETERCNMLSSIEGEIERIEQEMSQGVVQLVLDVAEKLCHKRFEEDASIIQSWVQEALSRIGKEQSATVRLHPEDGEIIQRVKDEILQSRESIKQLIVEYDPTVERGGCIVRSQNLLVDASVTTRQKELAKGLSGDHAN